MFYYDFVISLQNLGFLLYSKSRVKQGGESMNRKIYYSIVSILIILMLVFTLVQNNEYDAKVEQLNIKNQMLSQQLTQLNVLTKEIEVLEDENYLMSRVLSEEKEVADSYRELVGNNVSKDLVAQAKSIEEETPIDFETAYYVAKYADLFDLNVSLVLSVMELESNFGQFEVGTSEDRGYMQIIPATEEWLATTYGDEIGIEYNPEKIYEPEYNIGLASIYLSLLKNNYGNDYNRILSEYNRGPYNLREYFKENNTYETTYSRVILNKESKYLALNN